MVCVMRNDPTTIVYIKFIKNVPNSLRFRNCMKPHTKQRDRWQRQMITLAFAPWSGASRYRTRMIY